METELTLLELYRITLTEFKKKHDLFICRTIRNLPRVSYYHQMSCLEHFKTQFPSTEQYQWFFNNKLFNRSIKFKHDIPNSEWFVYPEKIVDGDLIPLQKLYQSEGFEIRVKFLETIIELLEREENAK